MGWRSASIEGVVVGFLHAEVPEANVVVVVNVAFFTCSFSFQRLGDSAPDTRSFLFSVMRCDIFLACCCHKVLSKTFIVEMTRSTHR